MSVTAFDGQFSFKQDSLARLGHRDTPKMTGSQWSAFQNSPFMQSVRKVEDLCWRWTCARDEKRAKTDSSFRPQESDFTAPKAHEYDKQINYYKVLGISEYASLDEVKKAYKKLSLIYHPDKSAGLEQAQKDEHAAVFIELKNAYLTLADNATRRQYDRDRDRDVASSDVNGYKVKQKAHFDATELLRKMAERQKPEGKTVDVAVQCKLEKFVFGGHKAVKRSRRAKKNGIYKVENFLYRVDIPRAVSEPVQCLFKGRGDQQEHTLPDSIKFKITSKPHPLLDRRGDDLILKNKVIVPGDPYEKPYVSFQAPSVNGRHIIFWGRNPFYCVSGSGEAELRVRLQGAGVSAEAYWRCVVRLGGKECCLPSASGADAFGSGDSALVAISVRHLQTDAQLHLRVDPHADIGAVRRKVTDVLGFGRNATVRLVQSLGQAGYTPYPDKQPLGDLRSLLCVGTPWHGPSPWTPESAILFLHSVAEAAEAAAEASSSEGASSGTWVEPWAGAEHVLLDYGFAPTTAALKRQVELCMGKVDDIPERTLRQLVKLPPSPSTSPADPDPVDAQEGDDVQLRGFLDFHGLGPPGGFSEAPPPAHPEAQERSTEVLPAGGQRDGDACSAPAMSRRAQRAAKMDPVCHLELEPLSEPIALFTRPSCSVTFYGNRQQLQAARGQRGAGATQPEPMLAIALSSEACAKRKAKAEWEHLKRCLVPVLQASAFILRRDGRAILPRPLAESGAWSPEAPLGTASEPSKPSVPWKQLADSSYRRGDYYTAVSQYSSCLGEDPFESPEAMDSATRAAVFSNRAGCLAKLGFHLDSLEDAKRAVQERPRWARAWSRAGLAASKLGTAYRKESLSSYMKAVELEPSQANVDSLLQAALDGRASSSAEPHSQKEKGNEALRIKEYSRAIAHYTLALASLPPADVTSARASAGVADTSAAHDPHALLRSVLFCNRAGAFCHLGHWTAATADAKLAVSAKSDFVKARCQLGTALLGMERTEEAYSEFARALQLEPTCRMAIRGREACLGVIPLWQSLPARRRRVARFGADLQRPSGGTKVYAISDVFFDHRCNEDWAHSIDDFRFQEDVLIVAGNMCDSHGALVRALGTFKSKFRRVFYVPGNHEMWLHSAEVAKFPDSLSKFLTILATCDDLGVDVFPAAICNDIFILPLFSWYNAEFDTVDPFPDANGTSDMHCKWPLDPATQLWKYMLKLNEASLAHPYHGAVISFSHFLPNASLPTTAPAGSKAMKCMGCEALDEQVRRAKSDCHIYGHSARRSTRSLQKGGALYVNHYLGTEGEHQDPAPILLVHDGTKLVQRAVLPV